MASIIDNSEIVVLLYFSPFFGICYDLRVKTMRFHTSAHSYLNVIYHL